MRGHTVRVKEMAALGADVDYMEENDQIFVKYKTKYQLIKLH